ncbi:MAG: hypothetical protein RBR34_08140 [Rhodospirillaceae bacterium]|nr:hypothetical protein [Rhodospirillaceae bacterium]
MPGMAVNPDKTVRKIFSLPKELWQQVDDYRFSNRIGTEAEAIRRLIGTGLKTDEILDLLQNVMDDFDRAMSYIDDNDPAGRTEHQHFAEILRDVSDLRKSIEAIIRESAGS